MGYNPIDWIDFIPGYTRNLGLTGLSRYDP